MIGKHVTIMTAVTCKTYIEACSKLSKNSKDIYGDYCAVNLPNEV